MERCSQIVEDGGFRDRLISTLHKVKDTNVLLEVECGPEGLSGEDIGAVLQQFALSDGKGPPFEIRRISAKLQFEPESLHSREVARQETRSIPRLEQGKLPEKPADGRGSKFARDVDFSKLKLLLSHDLESELTRLHDPLISRLQQFLDDLAGTACPTFDENHELTSLVNGLLDKYGAIVNMLDEKGVFHSVRMKCIQATGSVGGTFQGRDSRGKPISTSAMWPRLVASRSKENP